MKVSKKILNEHGVRSRLRLGSKTPKGVVSTGQHKVVLVSDEKIKKLDYLGNQKEYVRYTLKEGNELKYYDVPLYNSNKEIHYLIQRLAELNEGQEIIIELKNKNARNYVEITPIKGQVIEAEYDNSEIDDEEMHDEAEEWFTEE